MIEVEIRGKLSEAEYERVKAFLEANGKFLGAQKREMYQLFDYPGYDRDPTKRDTDIRIRNTDGFCEIMVKHKASDGNVARKEISLELKENTLDKAKEVVKAFGCRTGRRMVRERLAYEHSGVEWLLVNCPPKNIKYFEIEKEVEKEEEIAQCRQALAEAAAGMKVHALDDNEMKEFIYWLDQEVNEIVEL